MNERTCVREAVLAATGVRTRASTTCPRPHSILRARIAHLGFLHDRLKEFIDPSSGLMPQGQCLHYYTWQLSLTVDSVSDMFCIWLVILFRIS